MTIGNNKQMSITKVKVMIKWIKYKLEQRRTKVEKDLYERGWEYAAGHLLRTQNDKQLRGEVACSKDFGNYSIFDYGIERAIETAKKIGVLNK